MKVWSNNLPLNDSRLSPIYGELFGLPPIYIYLVVEERFIYQI